MPLLHAAGDDQGARRHFAQRLQLQDLAAPVDAHAHHLLADELLDAVLRGLGEELLYQVGAGDELVAGVVGDVAGRAELAADVHGHDDRAEVLARRVHGGGEACGPAAHDGDVVERLELDRLPAEPPVELAGGVEPREVVVAAHELAAEEDLGHAAPPRALDHLLLQALVDRDVPLGPREALGAQERLGLGAVRAPLLGVDEDVGAGHRAQAASAAGASSAAARRRGRRP